MFLVYPLLGHLADVYLTRYRTLKCGIIHVAILVSLLLFFVATLTHTLLYVMSLIHTFNEPIG